MTDARWRRRCSTHLVGGPDYRHRRGRAAGTRATCICGITPVEHWSLAMKAVEHDVPVVAALDFPPLMTWQDVMQDELEDRLGFARRATLALLTQSGEQLVAGFAGGNRRGLEGAMKAVALFQAHLQEMERLAGMAERRLQRVGEALAAAD